MLLWVYTQKGKIQKENDKWENKNENKTHWQCPSSSCTSPILF